MSAGAGRAPDRALSFRERGAAVVFEDPQGAQDERIWAVMLGMDGAIVVEGLADDRQHSDRLAIERFGPYLSARPRAASRTTAPLDELRFMEPLLALKADLERRGYDVRTLPPFLVRYADVADIGPAFAFASGSAELLGVNVAWSRELDRFLDRLGCYPARGRSPDPA